MNIVERQELEEIKERGTPLFPIGFYVANYAAPGSILHYHWHTHSQWVYMLEGTGVFTVEGTKYKLSKDESLFVGSGQLHSGITDNPMGCKHLSIVFPADKIYEGPWVVNQYFEDFRTGRYIPETVYRNDTEGGRRINACLRNINALLNAPARGYEILVYSYMQAILGITLQHHLYTSRSPLYDQRKSANDPVIEFAFHYIHNHYQEHLTTQTLAQVLDISDQKLCKLFKLNTGTTIIEYLNNYRVYEACMLLRNTSHSIAKVAETCGFDTPSYFIKVFKRIKGVTPLTYKQNADQNSDAASGGSISILV